MLMLILVYSGDNEFDDFKNPGDFADGYDYGSGYQATMATAAGPRYPQASGGQYVMDTSIDGGKKTDSYI